MSNDEKPQPVPPRLALVGAASLLGKEIRDQLAASGFPGDAVALFDLEELAGVLTDYGDEARVFAATVAERVLEHELVCFCGQPAIAAEYLDRLLDAEGLGLDCTGVWLTDERAFAWIPGATATPRLGEQRATVIPHAATLMLGSASAALDGLGSGMSASVFLPASERGDAGLSELSQQSTAVLNLRDVDQKVFGRRQAFDLWPAEADHPLCGERLGATLAKLGLPVPAIEVISAPVFHGLALSLFVAGAEADAVRDALGEAGFALRPAGDAAVDSPVRAVGRSGLHGLDVRADAGGVWVWAVADNLHGRATAAVAAIHTLLGTPASDALQ